jgi:cytochrome c
MKTRLILSAAGLAAAVLSAPVQAVDADAAQALAKKEGCLKCHAVDKKKDYASLKEISKKYAGKPDAEAKILNQITAGVKVKFDDGTEDEHKTVKTKDKAELSNLIQWILSLK